MKIKDLNFYTNEMAKSLYDKAFFIDKIDTPNFLDFGCADGKLIAFLAHNFPGHRYCGYDISPEMAAKADDEIGKYLEDAFFTSDWREAIEYISDNPTTLILSSVIHEALHYGSIYKPATYLCDFINQVIDSRCKYIAIRDMIPSKNIVREADIEDTIKVYRREDPEKLDSFENKWGSLRKNKNLLHYLLKYRYEVNWDREVEENYFPIFLEDFLKTELFDYYDIIYKEEFVVPFIKNKVWKDFGINIQDNTHVKMILKIKEL